jgi:hypothetical protein
LGTFRFFDLFSVAIDGENFEHQKFRVEYKYGQKNNFLFASKDGKLYFSSDMAMQVMDY